MTSGKSGNLILEIIVLLLQPYSFLEGLSVSMSDNYDALSFDFKLNYILVFLGFSKLFIILRVVLTNTIYMSPRCNCPPIQLADFAECTAARATTSTPSNACSKTLRCC